MNHALTPTNALNTELLAGALQHLKVVMESESPRSCAVACILFSCLAQDEGLGEDLCAACQALGECLERLAICGKTGSAR